MRFGVVGGRAVVVADGGAVDVAVASDGRFGPDPLAVYDRWSEFREWEQGVDLAAGPRAEFDPRSANAPSPQPRQVFGIGLNYRAHQIESGLPEPDFPLVFTKFPTSVAPAHGVVGLPTSQVDWEVELAVVLGRRAHRIGRADAWDVVAGITAAQDLSARDVQMRPAGSPQFSLGKSFPGFTPLGPLLVTPDELADPDDVPVACAVNGEQVQRSSTADMIFSVGELIEYLSGVLPLLPGDVILTGTPAGVGMSRSPAWFLAPGDVVTTTVADQEMITRCVTGTAL